MARRLRLPARTARTRLTLIYAGMVVALGTVAFATTYAVNSGSETVSAVPTPGTGAARTGAGASVKSFLVRQHSADVHRLLAVSLLVLGVVALASVLLGWLAAGRVLRPLRHMTARARTISAGNLSERLALTGPDDEFRALGGTLDELLARLEAAFEAQRRFVANAAHELRTPLTLERTLLQVALADPDASAAQLRATCEELLAAGRDQERLLEALLTLATSERGLESRRPVDLAAVARRAVGDAQPRITERRLKVVTALDAAPTLGDPALLGRLVANLVDNAIEYNRPDGRIEVRTSTGPGGPALSVANSGPEVSPQEAERLFEPFARGEATRTASANGHHGLGLSIVRAIAATHRGEVSASPRPEGGLEVTVRLPAGTHSAPAQTPGRPG